MTSEEMVIDVSQDWILACDVQQAFMQPPQGVSGRFDTSARCRQVRALGGDCYGFIPQNGDRMALVVGDASGKGLAAALMIANVQSSLRTAALFAEDDLAAQLKAVNHQAYASSPVNRYATLFYGMFDRVKRTLRYINAGHNPPVVLRRDGAVEWLATSGAPVGLFPTSTFEEKIVELGAGDLVIAYTDGVVEATDANGEEWGVQGLVRAVCSGAQSSRNSGDLVDSIFQSIDHFSQERQSDDATVAVVRVI